MQTNSEKEMEMGKSIECLQEKGYVTVFTGEVSHFHILKSGLKTAVFNPKHNLGVHLKALPPPFFFWTEGISRHYFFPKRHINGQHVHEKIAHHH